MKYTLIHCNTLKEEAGLHNVKKSGGGFMLHYISIHFNIYMYIYIYVYVYRSTWKQNLKRVLYSSTQEAGLHKNTTKLKLEEVYTATREQNQNKSATRKHNEEGLKFKLWIEFASLPKIYTQSYEGEMKLTDDEENGLINNWKQVHMKVYYPLEICC